MGQIASSISDKTGFTLVQMRGQRHCRGAKQTFSININILISLSNVTDVCYILEIPLVSQLTFMECLGLLLWLSSSVSEISQEFTDFGFNHLVGCVLINSFETHHFPANFSPPIQTRTWQCCVIFAWAWTVGHRTLLQFDSRLHNEFFVVRDLHFEVWMLSPFAQTCQRIAQVVCKRSFIVTILAAICLL